MRPGIVPCHYTEERQQLVCSTNLTANEALQIYDLFHRAANPHKDFDNDDADDDEKEPEEDPLQQRLDKEKVRGSLLPASQL